MRKSLIELNQKRQNGFYLTDKGTIHDYLPIYEFLFHHIRNSELNIFEVGYQHGGSSYLWSLYFPKATIRSIDIDNTCPPPRWPRARLDIIDIANLPIDYFSDFIPDIAIDDGSHHVVYQLHFLRKVYPVLSAKGILIIEDVSDFEANKYLFDEFGYPYDVIDNRTSMRRFDELMLIFQKP